MAIWYQPVFKGWILGTKEKLGSLMGNILFNGNLGPQCPGNDRLPLEYNQGTWIPTNGVQLNCSYGKNLEKFHFNIKCFTM